MRFLSNFFRPKRRKVELPKPDMTKVRDSFPFELLEVPGNKAVAAFHELRRQGQAQGFSPLIISDDQVLARCYEILDGGERNPTATLQTAATVSVPQWFAERDEEEGYEAEVEIGIWPAEVAPQRTLEAVQTGFKTKTVRRTVYLVKLPTPNSWEIPAYLPFGGWNACPMPEEHVAIARQWHEHYGATIAATAGDTLEYFVERPPQDKGVAEQLAREHFLYCTDIVEQGVGTLRNLAATVLNAEYWFFWWD